MNSPMKLKYDVDVTALDEAANRALVTIDRDKINASSDRQFRRLHHPLVQQQVGPEVALNVEVYNAVTWAVIPHVISDRVGNKAELVANGKRLEQLFSENAKDPEDLMRAVHDLVDAVMAIQAAHEQGPHRDEAESDKVARGALEIVLRRKLPMPRDADEFVTYPVAGYDLHGVDEITMRRAFGNIARDAHGAGLDGVEEAIAAASAFIDQKFPFNPTL